MNGEQCRAIGTNRMALACGRRQEAGYLFANLVAPEADEQVSRWPGLHVRSTITDHDHRCVPFQRFQVRHHLRFTCKRRAQL